MKKIILSLSVVLLALIVLAGVLIYLFHSAAELSGQLGQTQSEEQSLQAYIAEDWPGCTFRSYDRGRKTLELCVEVRHSYEQVQRFGEAADYPAVAAGHLETAALIAAGCQTHCGVEVQQVVFLGISSDGQEVYRASTESGVHGCWEDAP